MTTTSTHHPEDTMKKTTTKKFPTTIMTKKIMKQVIGATRDEFGFVSLPKRKGTSYRGPSGRRVVDTQDFLGAPPDFVKAFDQQGGTALIEQILKARALFLCAPPGPPNISGLYLLEWQEASDRLRQMLEDLRQARVKDDASRRLSKRSRRKSRCTSVTMPIQIDGQWNRLARRVEKPIPYRHTFRDRFLFLAPNVHDMPIAFCLSKERRITRVNMRTQKVKGDVILRVKYPFERPCDRVLDPSGGGGHPRALPVITVGMVLRTTVDMVKEMFIGVKLRRAGVLLNRTGVSSRFGATCHGPEDLCIGGFTTEKIGDDLIIHALIDS